MSTVSTLAGNGQSTGGFWLTVSDLAREKGIDKGGLSRKVLRLEADGLVSTKPGPRGAKLVNVAEYDRAVGEIGDTLRAVIAEPPPAVDDAVPTSSALLTTERARREGYAAELARLELEERQGKLVDRSLVVDTVRLCSDAIVRPFDTLANLTDELVTACHEGGAPAVRSLLKLKSLELRNKARDAVLGVLTATESDVGEPTAAA